MTDDEILLLLSGESESSSYQDSYDEVVTWGPQYSADSKDDSIDLSNTHNGKLPLDHSE